MEFGTPFFVDLLASEYEKLMGNGLTLDGWIASSLSKITSIEKTEFLEEIQLTDRIGMLSLCSEEALEVIANLLQDLMKSDRVRDRLREIQSSPKLSISIYGPSKVLAINHIAQDFEYINPEPEPIEFIDIDPETKAQILQQMEAA